MRTILLLGIAAGTLLLASHANSAEPAAPPTTLDYGSPSAPDARVYTGYPDRIPSEVDYREVGGTYDAEGRWTGTWNGSYEAPDGRRYDGTYEGTVEGRPGADYPPPPEYDPYYDGAYRGGYDGQDAQMARRCGRGGTVTGAVVGGVVGGLVGNRVAGHGDRTAGTLIGGGAGALAGAAVGNGADRKACDEWWAGRERYRHGGYPGGPYQGGYAQSYSYGGYGYGYGYYTPGVVVTTIISGAPVVTERVVTSTRTYYENVPVRKRTVAKRKWKPKPKPRCGC
ncbi:hypothetical protein CVO77_07325 [Sphingopyxis lindanitolerans]|uniref:17 kDa surface antigen n=1 Tax=Sphingopyxis lindanitolerans TaxID=2054227 RepID=A0A2S8B7B0_9SPHN|nr:glycine zipper 2TM domain-containing protein [Sphingopyxis lindanitolerans]PQM28301.1 hypothetical protein CVO77_07325 [Sphingopyxis lindanitolerans]